MSAILNGMKVLMCRDRDDVGVALANELVAFGVDVSYCKLQLENLKVSVKAHSYDAVVLCYYGADYIVYNMCAFLRNLNRIRPVFFLTCYNNAIDIGDIMSYSGTYLYDEIDTIGLVDIIVSKIDNAKQAEKSIGVVTSKNVVKLGDIELNLDLRKVFLKGESVKCQGNKFDILRMFLENEGKLIKPHIIYNDVWKPPVPVDEHDKSANGSVRKEISDLRAILKGKMGLKVTIENELRLGYRFAYEK